MGLLLILLVGDLTAPLKPHLETSLPAAFGEPSPELHVGTEAPAGRNVAWVNATGPNDFVLTLHTARIAGDLRRELHFSAKDKLPERARAIAFALSVLAKEREAALAALPPESPPPPATVPVERSWELEARGVGTLSIGEGALGGGGQLLVHRLLPFGLSVGLGGELNGSSAKDTTLTQGGAWAEVNLRFVGPLIVPRLTLGIGALANILTNNKASSTLWLPLFRVAVDATWRFFEGHGVVLGLASHFTTASLPVGSTNNGMGQGNQGALGPLWLRVELGYSLTL